MRARLLLLSCLVVGSCTAIENFGALTTVPPGDMAMLDLPLSPNVGDPCSAGPNTCTNGLTCENSLGGITATSGYCTRSCSTAALCPNMATDSCRDPGGGAKCLKACAQPQDCRINNGYQCCQLGALPAKVCLPMGVPNTSNCVP